MGLVATSYMPKRIIRCHLSNLDILMKQIMGNPLPGVRARRHMPVSMAEGWLPPEKIKHCDFETLLLV